MASWFPQEIVPNHGFNIGLCCWWVRHSEIAVPRWTSVSKSPYCWASISDMVITLFVCPSFQFSSDCWWRLANVNWLNHFIYLVVYYFHCGGCFLAEVSVWYKNFYTLYPFASAHPLASTPDLFSPVTQNFPPNPLTSLSGHSLLSMILYIFSPWTISPSTQVNDQVCQVRLLPL